MDKVAQSHCERPTYVISFPRGGRWPGELQDMNFFWDLQSHVYSAGIPTWKGDICRSRGPAFSKNFFLIIFTGHLNTHILGGQGCPEVPRNTH